MRGGREMTGDMDGVDAIDPELKKEYEAYLAQPDEWKEANRGKFVVFKDGEVAGLFDTSADALRHALDKFGTDGFLVHQVGEEENPHSSTLSILGCV